MFQIRPITAHVRKRQFASPRRRARVGCQPTTERIHTRAWIRVSSQARRKLTKHCWEVSECGWLTGARDIRERRRWLTGIASCVLSPISSSHKLLPTHITTNPHPHPHKMNLVSLFCFCFVFCTHPLVKVWNAIRQCITSAHETLHLSYTIATLQAELARLKTAASDLSLQNATLAHDLVSLTDKAHTQNALAIHYRTLADEYAELIDLGVLWVVGALEKIAVVEHAAREMQVELVEEIALRDRRIAEQDEEAQVLKIAASELARQNAVLKQELACVTDEMLQQQAAADHYSELASDYAETIDVGVLCILGALEKIAVVEHGAREAQVELMEEIALKDQLIGEQDDEAQALREAHDAALARIAVLEAELDKKSRDQQEQLSKTRHRQAARELASAKIIHSKEVEIRQISKAFDALKADTAAALARQVEKDAEAAANAKKYGKKIKALKLQVAGLEATSKRALIKQAEQAREMEAQAGEIAVLKAELESARVDARERAAKAVVEQLRVAGVVQGAETRAREAEERAKDAEREKASARESAKITVALLARRHAEELALVNNKLGTAGDVDMVGTIATAETSAAIVSGTTAVETPAPTATAADADMVDTVTETPTNEVPARVGFTPSITSTDFSLDCQVHFATQFIVRADSQFAQASVAEPSRFVPRSERKIVRRGGDSVVTPLLLPAWPAPRVLGTEGVPAAKRAKRD
ncbi:hypothetical protein B0H11DRAFT_507455 [Mycena galericulata]|nr:hypothetical protein B0H11DRAFT_507455 [Mycena galericulata]